MFSRKEVGTAKENLPLSADRAVSAKLLSSCGSAGEGRRLTVHEIDNVVANVKTKKINLISIFGRARQGKSFLMNCLSGEKELFTVSNKKDSCTQGIDISSKWLTLSDFSKLDNDSVIKTSSESECFVGFVDAEGQGDRDVTYDSELVCPILLLSKVVIFIW